MTELQMGLIGLGAFAVVGVIAYNKWQEARQRKLTEQAIRISHPDVLLGEGTALKGMAPLAEESDAAAESEERDPPAPFAFGEQLREPRIMGERIEPVMAFDTEPDEPPPLPENRDPEKPEAVVSPSVVPDTEVPDYSHLLSPQVDFIAAIDTVDSVAASGIYNAQREIQARVRKPVRWIGYSGQAAKWEIISDQSQGEYQRIRAGLQLVNRQGPVSNTDLTNFSTAMQDLADQFSGIVDLPPRQEAYEAAEKLDEFCVSVDIQIGINVISRGQPFPNTKVRTLAEAAGMAIDDDKRFVRRDENGDVIFSLLNQDTAGFSADTMKTTHTHGVTFLLDVPCVVQGERVFNQMFDLALHFAKVLRGELVDDNQQPLSEGSLGPIRQQIAQFQSQLMKKNLPPGTPLTRRLFS